MSSLSSEVCGEKLFIECKSTHHCKNCYPLSLILPWRWLCLSLQGSWNWWKFAAWFKAHFVIRIADIDRRGWWWVRGWWWAPSSNSACCLIPYSAYIVDHKLSESFCRWKLARVFADLCWLNFNINFNSKENGKCTKIVEGCLEITEVLCWTIVRILICG